MNSPFGYFLVAFIVFILIAAFRQQSGRGMAGLRYPFAFLVVAFFGLWLFSFIRGEPWQFSATAVSMWLVVLMCLLVVIGLGGVVASVLSALGPLRLPATYEWPAGYVRGVITTTDGKHIVPLWPSGRVQIYDSQWHFIRGWNVDAWGGYFDVQSSSEGVIEVLTYRGDRHYSFTEEGKLISSKRSSEPLPLLSNTGRSVVVPTRLLLWVFSSPILSGATAVIGFAGLEALNKIGH
jgi:hypothetical protein